MERALLVQVLPAASAPPADRGPAGARRPGRERRGDRRRRRHRRRHPDREPQPPVRHRALPGRGHGRGRDPPRHLHHGCAPTGRHGSALLRAPGRRRPATLARRGCGERDLGLRQLRRGADGGRGADLRPLLRAEPARQRALHGRAARRAPGSRHRVGPGQSRRAARLQHRARRHRGRQRARLGRVQRRRRGGRRRHQAPERAGGRPLRGEAAHRGVPRTARHQARGRDPGSRRRRPGLCDQRDRSPGRRRHGRRRDRRAPARGGHGTLGGDDQREPGAHARHRHPRVVARGGRHLRQVGGAGHGRRHGDGARPRRRGAPAYPRRQRRSRPRRRAGRVTLGGRAALRPAPPGARVPPDRAAGRARRLRRRPPRAVARSRLGLPPVRPPAVLEHRGGSRRGRGAPAAGGPGVARLGAGRRADDRFQPPRLPRWTRGRAPRSPSPRPSPTWRAWVRRRPPS